MKKLIYAYCCLTVTALQLQAQPLVYKFNNNLSEQCGQAPPLQPFCTDTFSNDILPDLGSINRVVYHFGQNCALVYDNAAAGNFISESYSLEMYFKFDNTTTFSRILDFKNRTSDYGLYCTENQLQFYNANNIATNAFQSGQYVHLVVTRDSASSLVELFINGQLLDSFTDTTNIAVVDTSNMVRFFQDDLAFGGEANPGAVALIRIYNNPLDSAQVATAFSGLQTDLTPNDFTVNDAVQCMEGNNYVFTNNSPDTTTTLFTWYFDDGDSSQDVNASHSYLTAGKYDVMLVITNSAGCTDTVIRIVSVFAQPVPDLGPDQFLCNQAPLTLDAGSFTGYLWNDGSTSQTLSAATPGIYWVTVTDINGCTGLDSLLVSVTPAISLGVDSFFCGSVSVQLDAGAGFASYLWSDGSTLQTLVVNDSGQYSVTIEDGNGCINADTVWFGILDLPELDLGNDTVICENSVLVLDAGAFFTYLWQDSSQNQSYNVTTAGTYAVRITSFSGCSSYDTLVVSTNPAPVVNLGGDSSFCGFVSINLDAGLGSYTYLWNDGSTTQTLSVNDSGLFFVEVTDTLGCRGTDTIALGILSLPAPDLGEDTSLCQGASLQLDAGAFAAYSWQDGSTAQTFTVTTGGVYFVQVADLTGCINTDTIQVSLFAMPVVNLGSDTAYCDNVSVVLQAGSGFTSYVWNDGSTLSSLSINAAGSYSVLISDTNGCQATDSITIGLGITPVFTLPSDSSVCPGTSVMLDAGAGFYSYQWSHGATTSAVVLTDSGTYTVVVSDSLGCSSSDSYTLSLLPAPVVTLGADTAFCFGGSVLLDAGPGFTSYLWNDGTILQTFLVTLDGVYVVEVTNSFGCTGTDTVVVIVYPGPMTPNIFVSGGTTLVSNQPAGNQWYNANGPIPGATDSFYVPLLAGSYYVIVTDSNGCHSAPSNTIVWGLGVFSPTTNGFTVYPNPVKDVLHLITGLNSNRNLSIELTDLTGRLILAPEFKFEEGSMETTIHVAGLQPGIYLIRVVDGSGFSVARFIKQ